MSENKSQHCPACNAKPGMLHRTGCDVEHCPRCGQQLLTCGHFLFGTVKAPPDQERLPWTGEWPGVQECREFGWWAKPNPEGSSYEACAPAMSASKSSSSGPAHLNVCAEGRNQLQQSPSWGRVR
jgi:hypothetical protein